MEPELDDNEAVSLRDEDKTRRFFVATSGPTIDDLGDEADTAASPLPPPIVAPFEPTQSGERPAVRANTPAPRTISSAATKPTNEPSMSNQQTKPPLPPIPVAAKPEPAESPVPSMEHSPSSPTIVVKPIVHVPTPSRMQREATVMVKRALPSTRRTPLAMAVVAAVVIVASAIAFVGIKRAVENHRRQQLIEERIEEVRRQHAE